MYLKRISRILTLIFIFNIFLVNINVLKSNAEVNYEYDFIELEENIKDIQLCNNCHNAKVSR